jgi:tetratricopeptide (TPR) repeat protein
MILAISPGLWYFGFRKAEDPDAIWQSGEAHLKADRIDLAEAAANRLSQLREPTPLDCLLRAQIDIAQGRDEEAVAGLMRVPDEHPMVAQAQLLAGQIELRRHRARFAEQYLRKAIQLDPKLVQAHRELIYILGYQLRRPELNAEFLALSQLTELTFDNVFHWCLMRTAQWEPSTALKELLLFIQADPEDRWSRLAIADDYRRMGLIDDAEIAIAPLPDSDVDVLAIRVMLAIDRHEDDKAEQLLASGPAGDPKLAKLRGRLALARRDAPTAVRCFQDAYAYAPEDRDSLLGLLSALTMIGDEKSAAPLHETAKKFELINSLVQRAAASGERHNPRLIRELGAACAAAGRDPEARGWYRLAIARDPLDIESQQALFRIDNRERSLNPTAIRGGERPEG